MEKIVEVGRVELLESEALKMYNVNKYIVTYSAIFQLFYSVNAGVYGQKIYQIATKGKGGFTRRGRFYAMDAKTVNHLVGFSLVNE